MIKNGPSLFDLVPGKTIAGHYRIESTHRQGGMAATFAVVDEKNGEKRELQIFHGTLFEDAEQASKFGDRLEAWKNLAVPGVAQLHDIDVCADGTVLCVSDFPEGAPARELIDAGPLDTSRTLRLGTSLLEGLGAVHQAGLVHGDIKPATIFCDEEDDHALFVDGGITPALWAAKHVGTHTALIGTPYYAPLEQFTGDAPDDLCDLYSLATVMYEMITGVLPWSGTSYVEVFQSKMMKAPPKMSIRAPGVEIEPALEAVIARGMSGERRGRYASAGEFLEALTGVVTVS